MPWSLAAYVRTPEFNVSFLAYPGGTQPQKNGSWFEQEASLYKNILVYDNEINFFFPDSSSSVLLP